MTPFRSLTFGVHWFIVQMEGFAKTMVFSLLLTLSISGVATVDEAIELYMMGDIPGAITSLEEMLQSSSLSFDEQLRAYDRHLSLVGDQVGLDFLLGDTTDQ